MKKCPYCAEEILDEALKCRHCGEFLNKPPEEKWYFKTSSLVFAFLCLGPLALPLLWLNPRFNKKSKTVTTIVVVILTYLTSVVLAKSVKAIINYYQIMLSL